VKAKGLAFFLIIAGVAATLAGLFGQVFLAEDEGHHDGRTFSFALSDSSGADELVVESTGPNEVLVRVERAGQPLASDMIHDASLHVFVVGENLESFAHVTPSDIGGDGSETAVSAPAGEVRVVVQTSPRGGPDLLELGASVEVDGEAPEPQNITTTDEWVDRGLTVRRQGLDFVLSESWTGDDVFGGPAFLSLFRADDFAFTHGHAVLVGDDRFSFAMDLPGSGEYLAALEFEQGGRLVTALFRVSI
jgi:hypothetical protein